MLLQELYSLCSQGHNKQGDPNLPSMIVSGDSSIYSLHLELRLWVGIGVEITVQSVIIREFFKLFMNTPANKNVYLSMI